MVRVCCFLACSVFVLGGCTSSKPQPVASQLPQTAEKLKSAEAISPDSQTKSDSAWTRMVLTQHQQELHAQALHLPRGLGMYAMDQKPCEAELVSARPKQKRRLGYDALGRLTKQEIITFGRLAGIPSAPPSETENMTIAYDKDNLLEGIRSEKVETLYFYKDAVLAHTKVKALKPTFALPEASYSFSYDESSRTVQVRVKEGGMAESGARTQTHVFDEKGRLVSSRDAVDGAHDWAYSTGPDGTQKVEHTTSGSKVVHLVKDGRLVSSTSLMSPFDQTPPKPMSVRTYTYKDEKLVGSTTTDNTKAGDAVAHNVVYKHTCS